jgi:hypothetical protein
VEAVRLWKRELRVPARAGEAVETAAPPTASAQAKDLSHSGGTATRPLYGADPAELAPGSTSEGLTMRELRQPLCLAAAHNPEVGGSNPAPLLRKALEAGPFVCDRCRRWPKCDKAPVLCDGTKRTRASDGLEEGRRMRHVVSPSTQRAG